jgi:NADH-quinone oxidoreductase subunit C
VGRLSDAPTDATDEAQAALPGDGLREGIVDALRGAIGDQLIDTHLVPQTDLWVRVTAEAWPATAAALKAQGFDYFCFLSAIDWLPSPYGKGEDDPSEEADGQDDDAAEPDVMKSGYTGGDSRFQVFGRLTDIRRHVGVTIKADVPDSMTVGSWIPSFAGANWHERETHEMFGIMFEGHPDLRNLYLPGEFEGFPLRKDFPLLARMVKPWPGIVDVEPMPADDDEAPPTADTAAGDAVEAATETSPEAAAGDPTIDESAEATIPDNPRGDTAPDGTGADAGSQPPDDDEAADAAVEAADAAVEAANATPAAVEPEPPGTADEPADAPAAASAEQLAAAEPSAADASETERAERAEDADEAGVSRLDTSDADTVPADLGPGTTTHSTDADAEAPTPGPATADHPDGLTPGAADADADADAAEADDDGDRS